jgi:hypothetical protein
LERQKEEAKAEPSINVGVRERTVKKMIKIILNKTKMDLNFTPRFSYTNTVADGMIMIVAYDS